MSDSRKSLSWPMNKTKTVRETRLNNTVLITGFNGFVGRNLVQYLKKSDKYHITGVTRDKNKIKTSKHQIDDIITYEELLGHENGFKIVIHLAGQVIKSGDNDSAEESYNNANYELTKLVYDRFNSSNISQKFIFLSSIHVLTEKPNSAIDESYPPKPFTYYGKSKFKAETYLIENKCSEKKTYILRPTMIHGPGNKGNLRSLYNYVTTGAPYFYQTLENQRSFISVENLCFILNELISNNVEEGLYHLADDSPTKTIDLLQTISDVSGMKIRRIKIPRFVLNLLSKVGEYLPIPFDESKYVKLTSDFIVDNSKIKQAIDKPLPISAREGIRHTIESFKNSEHRS